MPRCPANAAPPPAAAPYAALRAHGRSAAHVLTIVALAFCGCASLTSTESDGSDYRRKLTPELRSWPRSGRGRPVDLIVEVGANVQWHDPRQAAMAAALPAPEAEEYARLIQRLAELPRLPRPGDVSDVHERALLTTRIGQLSRRLEREKAAAAMVVREKNRTLARAAASDARRELAQIPGVEVVRQPWLSPVTVVYMRANASCLEHVARLDTVRQVGRSYGSAP